MTAVRNILIDSRLRETGDENSFQYALKWSVLNADTISLESVQLYHTQYTINNNNNKLYWTDSASVDHTSTLTNGNYTATALAAHITTVMNTDDTSAGDTYAVSFSSLTSKISFLNTVSNFELTFGTNTTDSVAYTIGFPDTDRSGSPSYTASDVVRLNPKYYLIYCDVTSANTYKADESNSIIAILPCSVNYGDMCDYSSQLAKTFRVSNKQISRLKFEVKDDRGNTADLNGVDWSMNLVVAVKSQ